MITEGTSPLLAELGRDECLRLLGAAAVGRVVVLTGVGHTPVIRPVNYVFDEASQSVVFRCTPGHQAHHAAARRPRLVRGGRDRSGQPHRLERHHLRGHRAGDPASRDQPSRTAGAAQLDRGPRLAVDPDPRPRRVRPSRAGVSTRYGEGRVAAAGWPRRRPALRVATMFSRTMSSSDSSPGPAAARGTGPEARSRSSSPTITRWSASGLRVLLESDGRFEVLGEAGRRRRHDRAGAGTAVRACSSWTSTWAESRAWRRFPGCAPRCPRRRSSCSPCRRIRRSPGRRCVRARSATCSRTPPTAS